MKKGHGPDPIDIHVGNRLRQARLEARMSQTKLGDILGVTFQQVQKNEKGINRIAMSRIQQISVALSKPVSWFFEGLEGGKAKTGNDLMHEVTTSRLGIRLAEAFGDLDDYERRKIVELAEVMAQKNRR